MRVLVDILHPAHVHIFRAFRDEMMARGHQVLVVGRDKDVTLPLLEAFGIPYISLSRQGHGRIGLATELLKRTSALIRLARKFRPDAMIGVMGPSIALAGRALGIDTIVLYDTEIAPSNRWVYPLATAVLTPEAYAGRVRGRHIRYDGYQELAYLHPNRFTPDPLRVEAFGISPPYSIARFVSWEASHDHGISGLPPAGKAALVEYLESLGTVRISSEAELPPALESRRLHGPIAEIHHVLALAEIVVGDSATMASEAALLGARSVFMSDRSAGVLGDQFRLLGSPVRVSPDPPEATVDAIRGLLAQPVRREETRALIEVKVDLTSWLVEMIESIAAARPEPDRPAVYE